MAGPPFDSFLLYRAMQIAEASAVGQLTDRQGRPLSKSHHCSEITRKQEAASHLIAMTELISRAFLRAFVCNPDVSR